MKRLKRTRDRGMAMIEIRNMREADASAVAQIEEAVFSKPWSRQGFLDALAMDDNLFFVAEEEGRILGYIGMYVALDEGEITNVAAAPEARRRGVGAKLIEASLKEADERGIHTVVLEVRVSNTPAINLYEKYGFVRQGIRKGFYELPREDAYIYLKEFQTT